MASGSRRSCAGVGTCFSTGVSRGDAPSAAGSVAPSGTGIGTGTSDEFVGALAPRLHVIVLSQPKCLPSEACGVIDLDQTANFDEASAVARAGCGKRCLDTACKAD